MREKDYFLYISYIIGHFAVDFACAYLLYHQIYHTEYWYSYLLVYNFCAFALQMPFGLIADRVNHNGPCATIGCASVILAYVLGSIGTLTIPLFAVITAGIGNALFHVGGGIDVLNVSREKAFLLGIFVSPGAFGIYLGMLLGKQNRGLEWMIILALLTIAISILVFSYAREHTLRSDNVPISFEGVHTQGSVLAIGCLFFVVCLRSYTGMISDFSWKGQGAWGILFLCAVVLGKTAGGFFCDWLGAKKASVISLGLATILYLFSGNPWFGITAVFFFNMTMPITLWALARIGQGCKGFSFGLLTFALFLGFAPVYLGWKPMNAIPAVFALAALASLGLLWFGIRKEVA